MKEALGAKGKLKEEEWTAMLLDLRTALEEHKIGDNEQQDLASALVKLRDDAVASKPAGKQPDPRRWRAVARAPAHSHRRRRQAGPGPCGPLSVRASARSTRLSPARSCAASRTAETRPHASSHAASPMLR